MDMESFFGVVSSRHDDWSSADEEDVNVTTVNMSLLYVDFVGRHPTLTYTYVTVLVLTGILGSIGNVMVLGAVCTYKKLRTTGNLFILNLAVADLGVTLVVYPFTVIGILLGPQFFLDKVALCHMVATICFSTCNCSLWSVAGIAVNRYIFLCRNSWYHTIFSWRKTFLYCLSLWVMCLLLDLPNYVGWGGHTFDLKSMACVYDRLGDFSFTIFFCSFGIGVPLIVVLSSYINIFLYVRSTRKAVEKMTRTEEVRDTRVNRGSDDIKLAKTLFTVFVVFFICWVPYIICVLIDVDDRFNKIVYVVAVQMAHTSSAVNSILYAATNRQFRNGYKAFLQLIVCRCVVSCQSCRNSAKLRKEPPDNPDNSRATITTNI